MYQSKMDHVAIRVEENGYGAFYIMEGADEIAKMEVAVAGHDLTAYHTYVVSHKEGQGLAKILLDTMISYARKNGLKVIPLCPYVHAQFKRHPEEYADVWKKQRI